MTTTDPRAAAIEAAAQAIHNIRCAPCDHPSKVDRGIARVAVAAAVPHLTAGLREVAEDFRDSVDWSDGRSNGGYIDAYGACARRLTQALDALERGGPDA